MTLKEILSGYEKLENIIYSSITFESSRNKMLGFININCPGIFKTIHIYYIGNIKIITNRKNISYFKIYESKKRGMITIINPYKKTLNNNINIEFSGFINKISKTLVTGYGQKNPIGMKIIKGNREILSVSDNKNHISLDSYVIGSEETEIIPLKKRNIVIKENMHPDRVPLSTISTKLPKSYIFAGAQHDKCRNCEHMKYPRQSNYTGICHLWNANIGLRFWCENWKEKKGGN